MKNTFINSINLNQNTNFPYLVLDVINKNSYPRNPGFLVMHWHEDLQFIYLHSGKISVKTLDEEIILNSGEAIFINKNIVHQITQLSLCHYNSFIFPDYFLKFYFGSPAENFVSKITSNTQFTLYHFDNSISWHKEILNCLKDLALLEKNKTEFYSYQVLVTLSKLWLEMIKNITIENNKSKNIVNARLEKFLRYINDHYTEEITLDNLAKSANVSKSECLRCFKSVLQTTPYKYIMEFRLSKAATMLKTTKNSIGNIALSVGFNQSSHFGKYFKEKTGLSPKEYRKNM